MLGEVRPWNFALDVMRAGIFRAEDDKGWRCTGRSEAGEQVWERSFLVKGRPDVFLVTVIIDPVKATTRALYAACITDGDKVPKVPGTVRRKTDAFRKRLQAMAKHDQQRDP